MENLLLILILAIVGGCAIGAYELLDANERDEYQGPTGGAERARAVVLGAVPTTLPRVSTRRPPAELWYVSPHGRGAGSAETDADPLDGRIRGLAGVARSPGARLPSGRSSGPGSEEVVTPGSPTAPGMARRPGAIGILCVVVAALAGLIEQRPKGPFCQSRPSRPPIT